MAGTICDSATSYLSRLSDTIRRIDAASVDRLAELLYSAWRERRRVFIFGNGGSALTASHMVCDFLKTASVDGQPRLQVFGLADNAGITTAIGNDISYDDVFRFPLAAYAQAGDLAIAISASGNSPNLLTACVWARENGVKVAALTGFSGGKLAGLADLHVNVPSDNYGVIEDLHLTIGHIAAQSLRSRLMRECAGAGA